MATSRMPTTREISAATGYSQSAVSHALRGTRNVSAETRERIMAAARRMGWKVNPLAAAYMAHLRRLKRPSTYQANLAFLMSNPAGGRVTDQLPHVQKHFKGAKERALELGYELEPVWLHEPHLTAKRLTGILRSRNIPGLIAPGVSEPASVMDKLGWSHFASVAMGFTPSKSRLHRVTADTFDGFALVLDAMRRLGYRRIAVVVSREYDEQVNHGVHFPVSYLRDRWGDDCRIDVCDYPTSSPAEIPGIQEWLARRSPEVVLGEEIAWQAIGRMGWRVPQDVAFANVDWSVEYKEIAGFNQRHELHGSVAVDLLVSQVTHNERGLPAIPRVVLVPGTWEPGASVPAAADRARARRAVNVRPR